MSIVKEALLPTRQPGVALALWFAVFGVIYLVSVPIYNVWFHPLRKYPGPRLWAATRIPYTRMIFSGTSHRKILELHQTYGDVVRISPDELSYSSAAAWNDIMDHTRMRRTLAHGFSAQAMLDHQPIIQSYVDMLMSKLRENCANGERSMEMTSWYNWTTFDIIGDLAFGEPFGCLRDSAYHPWISLIFGRIRVTALSSALRRFPLGEKLIQLFISKEARRQFTGHQQLTQEKVNKRLAETQPRADFMEVMAKRDGDMKFSYAELLENASLLIIAGSETTATTLSGVTYLLLTHQPVLQKTIKELRSSFTDESEIDLLSVQKLRYMLAVLQEALREFPPVVNAVPRKVQPGGDVICGQFVPENTILGIWQWPMYHNANNFTLPDSFIPERWLGDARFSGDSQEALQPFSFGPRNCIGKNLAYAEMRLILAKVLWNFDLSLHADSKDWLQRNLAYTVWQKPELYVHIKPRTFE
ncbi:cytochrome P450 [Trichoderma chlorosporum]